MEKPEWNFWPTKYKSELSNALIKIINASNSAKMKFQLIYKILKALVNTNIYL